LDSSGVEAKDLEPGDLLRDRLGRSIAIASIEWIDKGVRVQNVDVLSPHTFFAGGYLVHNKDPDPIKP
jgi:hypothetical protein